MASHDLEHQPDEQLVTKIADMDRQLKELRTLQLQGTSAVNMQPSGIYTTTSPPIVNTEAAFFMFTLTSNTAKMIFSTFSFTLYEEVIDESHIIGHGNSIGYDYQWRYNTDWQLMSNTFATNGYKSVESVWIKNNSGSTHQIIMRGEWRYIVNGGSVSVT